MPLVIVPHRSIPGRLGTERETRASIRSGVGRDTRTCCIDLAQSTYATGGWPLVSGVTGLVHVNNVFQLCGFDPYGAMTAAPAGLSILLNYADPTRPKLILREAGVEATNASTRAGQMWVKFIGRTG